jgi:hypothetical protein
VHVLCSCIRPEIMFLLKTNQSMFLVPADKERISGPVRIDSMVLLKTKAMNVPAENYSNACSMFLHSY